MLTFADSKTIGMKRLLSLLFLLAGLTVAHAQDVKLNRQHSFARHVPAGNYSGITHIGDGRFAIVDDKQPDGFYLFHINIHPSSGKIVEVRNEGFVASGQPNHDAEAIVYRTASNTLFISWEASSRVVEYQLNGAPTGRELALPDIFRQPSPNRGIEALAYDPQADCFWLTTESQLPADNAGSADSGCLRLQAFDGQTLQPSRECLYRMDAPRAKRKGRMHVKGVSAMTALPDGRLMVLERECFLPKRKLGAWAECRLYIIDTRAKEVGKRLLAKWRTRNLRFANYEGMCLGPVLDDGRQVVVLVSDSQNQYGSLLKDWFRTVIVSL